MFTKTRILLLVLCYFLTTSIVQGAVMESWNRQSDWSGQAGGNPADDGYGNPDVWLYEVWGVHSTGAHALSGSPWWEDGPMMVGEWVDLSSLGFPIAGWGMSSVGMVSSRNSYMSGGGSSLGGYLTGSVRWVNPLTEATDMTISGGYGIEFGTQGGGGTGQTDFAILRDPAGGGPLELLYHKRDTVTIVDAFTFPGPNYTHVLPAPIPFTAQPGDAIIYTGFPVSGADNLMLSIHDDLTIGQAPLYDSLTGQTLNGTFTPDGGGGGELVISDTCSFYCTGNVNKTYIGASVELDLTLGVDQSAGGIAKATWSDGTLTIRDSHDNVLLIGDLINLFLTETSGNPDTLGGTGLMQLTGGSLMPFLPGDFADVVQVSFSTSLPIDDFSAEFSCVTNLTLLPIPEPATMTLLVAGGLMILSRRRRRGAKALGLILAAGLLGVMGAADFASAETPTWNRQSDWPGPGAVGTTENNPGPDQYGNPGVWQYEYWVDLDQLTTNLDTATPWYTLPTDGLMEWVAVGAPFADVMLKGAAATLALADEASLLSQTYSVSLPPSQTSDAILVTWTNPLATAEHVYITGSYGANYVHPTPSQATGWLDMAIVRKPAGGGPMEAVYSQRHEDVTFTTSISGPVTVTHDLPYIDVLMQPGDQLLFSGLPINATQQIMLIQDDITVSVGSLYSHITVEMLTSQFTPAGPDAGVLSLTGACTLYCDGDTPATYLNADVACTLNLADDYSAGNRAMGLFDDGAITFTDDQGAVLLTCDLNDLRLEELTAGADTLLGSGTVQFTGGELAGYIVEDTGELVTISFAAAGAIDDFSTAFDCSTNLTISPGSTPEPATISLLTLGGLAILRRRSPGRRRLLRRRREGHH